MKRILFIAILFFALAPIGTVLMRSNRFHDFSVYYFSARSLLAGRTDLYAPSFAAGVVLDYRYPPLFIVLFSFLGLMSYSLAAAFWFWLSLWAIAGCVFALHQIIYSRSSTSEKIEKRKALWLIPFIITCPYFVISLKFGNAHLLVVSLWFLSLYLWLNRKDLPAALLMALAISFKVIPIFALPYFFLRKQWRFLGLTGIFLVCLNLLPAVYFGWERNTQLLEEWYAHVIVDQQEHERIVPINFSLKGQLERYLTDVDYKEKVRGTENTDTNFRAINALSLSTSLVQKLWLLGSLALYSLSLGLLWWRNRKMDYSSEGQTVGLIDAHNDKRNIALEIGLLMICSSLIGPLTQRNYYVVLLWPVALLAYDAWTNQIDQHPFIKWLLTSLACAIVLFSALPGVGTQRLLQIIGVDFYLGTIIFLALLLRLNPFSLKQSSDASYSNNAGAKSLLSGEPSHLV